MVPFDSLNARTKNSVNGRRGPARPRNLPSGMKTVRLRRPSRAMGSLEPETASPKDSTAGSASPLSKPGCSSVTQRPNFAEEGRCPQCADFLSIVQIERRQNELIRCASPEWRLFHRTRARKCPRVAIGHGARSPPRCRSETPCSFRRDHGPHTLPDFRGTSVGGKSWVKSCDPPDSDTPDSNKNLGRVIT
jgi:hypothetical protein